MIATRNLYVTDGRLRIRSASIKSSSEKAAQVEAIMRQQSGVRSVKANASTGCILIAFDTAVTHHHEILRMLEYLGCSSCDRDEGISPSDVVTGYLARTAIEFSQQPHAFGSM